jgi:hypothetical protein
MNDKFEDLPEKFKLIAINMDEEIEPPKPSDETDDKPAFTLGLEVMTIDTEEADFKIDLDEPDDDHHILVEAEEEASYHRALHWLNILGLAGARTFHDSDALIVFVAPEGSWSDLYFQKLPLVAAHREYGELLWSRYERIRLWLRENSTGEMLAQLLLVAPEPADSEPET